MPLQSFVDKVGPVISATWANAVDRLKFSIFADASTKPQARIALGSDLETTLGGLSSKAIEYTKTSAETTALVTPADVSVQPYDLPRGQTRYSSVANGLSVINVMKATRRARYIYLDDFITNTTPGTTNVLSAIQTVYDGIPTNATLLFGPDTYYLGNGAGLVLDGQKHLDLGGAFFTYDGSGTAVQLGGSASQRYISVLGPFNINRTATISHNGTQTAASQLLGTGLKLRNLADGFDIQGRRGWITGFAQGLYLEGLGAGCTNGEISNISCQDNLVDLFIKNDASANSFVTNITFRKILSTFNTAFYSGIVGSRCVETSRNGHTIDGNKHIGGLYETAKERKIKEDGSFTSYDQCYFDVSNGGTDIELTANSAEVVFTGSSDLRIQTILDSGASNSFHDPRYVQFRSGHDSASGEVWYTYSGTNQIPLRHKPIGVTLADDDTYTLPTGGSGLVLVGCGNEGGLWHIASNRTCTKLAGTANTVNTNTDTNLCVFDNGVNAVIVMNRLGSSLKTIIQFVFWV